MTDATQDTLTARLLSDRSKRPRLLSDCERLIEDEVGSKSGFTGLAIKGVYKVACSVKPGIIREALDGLLDDFVARLEPFYAQHRDAPSPPGAPSGTVDAKAFGGSLSKRPGEVADALLGITDDRAKRSKNGTLKGAYEKLRPQAKKHVEEAVPRVGKTLSALL